MSHLLTPTCCKFPVKMDFSAAVSCPQKIIAKIPKRMPVWNISAVFLILPIVFIVHKWPLDENTWQTDLKVMHRFRKHLCAEMQNI